MKLCRVHHGLLFLFFAIISGPQCNKVKEDLGRKFIIDAMTSGQWIVSAFTDSNIDITANFTNYVFQFKEDGTVIAINSATSAQIAGTWEGNVTDLTIFSNFPGASEPLLRLNDTWKITNNTTKLVEAQPFNTGRTAYLKLVKKT